MNKSKKRTIREDKTIILNKKRLSNKKFIESTNKKSSSVKNNQRSITEKSSVVYLIKCFNQNETFLKVGYTTRSIEQRFKDFPYRYKVINTIASDIDLLYRIEQAMHGIGSELSYMPKKHFTGYTECYKIEALNLFKKYFI
jgi:hypothetical protein